MEGLLAHSGGTKVTHDLVVGGWARAGVGLADGEITKHFGQP